MHSLVAAERLLSLLTPPERAVSIVGDLHEQARDHSPIWFWSQVIRAAIALFYSSLKSFRVWISVLLGFALLLVSFLLSGRSMKVLGYQPPDGYDTVWFTVGFLWPMVAAPFLIGVLLASFSRGREVAVCTAVAICITLHFFSDSLYWQWLWREMTSRHFRPLAFSAASMILPTLSLLTGGAIIRRRHLARMRVS